MKRSLLALVCGGVLAVAVPAEAATVTLDTFYSGYLGSVDPHAPADLDGETYYVNVLLDLAVSTTAVVNDMPGAPPNDEHTFDRSSNLCVQPSPCPDASGGLRINSANPSSDVAFTNWTYVLAKYGNTGYVWYVGNVDSPDVAELPSKGPNGNGLAHYTVFNAAGVPDGGSTMTLLGLGLLALAYVKGRS
jgi:hypothetical protein